MTAGRWNSQTAAKFAQRIRRLFRQKMPSQGLGAKERTLVGSPRKPHFITQVSVIKGDRMPYQPSTLRKFVDLRGQIGKQRSLTYHSGSYSRQISHKGRNLSFRVEQGFPRTLGAITFDPNHAQFHHTLGRKVATGGLHIKDHKNRILAEQGR
jgi:hypothetical protein